MKKVMKFVKGKREEETPVKNVSTETKKVVNEKVDDTPREDDFISRDKSITKLHKAVWNENSDKLKSIIKTHDIDITDKLDRTALYFAVLKNNPNIVNLLLENSANQNIPDIDGITPFLKSIQLGYKQCAANLLSYGADLKKTDKDSNSCLHFAVMGKLIDILSFLLEHNADSNIPNVNGEYPLHIAIQMQDKQMVEILLSHNADINIVNNSGLTPLILAEQLKNSDIVEMLENYSLKNSKENNLFPDEISHKSSYENVNTPKIDPKHSSKPESNEDTWNDSPITTPSKKHEKPLTKISKFFSEEIEITEEKSESDVSVKCSENTSPQSGIIPPPCKPLRSLEYLQSGMAMENRPVHLLTLGTVRTRHISMTESDHSKNNTPHRYSYQGDFQVATGDSFQKLPDHFSTADEKGDSVNISVKSKLLSKLECDSTMQSDWGSNESLPLDELSVGGKKEKSVTSSTSKNNSNNSNSGSIRDKSTDIFLQKQFSLLEDYEKNREKRCSVSYEMDLLTVKLDKNKDKADGKFDDIGNLLEDNNRINTQLENYAGQTDTLAGTTKSKSLPRNCEPYNSYHKGSFSLPRTLESGKDPFRDVRSYGYFKPRSHFSFSLKMLRGDKKSGFIDKLKSMFNKKSQIHLTEPSENGTWLYKKMDNEYYSSKVEGSFSGSEDAKKTDNLPTSKTLNNFSDLQDFDNDSSSNDPSFSNNEQNKVIEKKILSLNNMSRENNYSQNASCSKKCPDCTNVEEDFQPKYKSLFSVVKKPGPEQPVETVFCEDCSEFVLQKINDAEQSILSKESFINLLQEQLEQLKDRNIKSINETQKIYSKYGRAQQELLHLKHICTKYDNELQKLRVERCCCASVHDQVASKLKEEAENWKKQYEDLVTKINLEGSSTRSEETDEAGETAKTAPNEEKWRSIIQSEVTAAVNVLKENSQVVITSLENQNKKLENKVEKLQKELDAATGREGQLEKDLQGIKNKLADASLQREKIRCEYDKNYEGIMKTFLVNNERLEVDLKNMTKLYTDLQKEYEENVKIGEIDCKKSSEISDEFSIVKDEYRALTKSLTILSQDIVKAKENALAKNEELRQQVAEMGPAANMKQFINTITESLESIELTCVSKSGDEVSEQVTELNNSIADVEKINKLNSDIELKLCQIKFCKNVKCLEEENRILKEDMVIKCDNLLSKVRESSDELEIMCTEIKSKNNVIENQRLQICNLTEIIDNEKEKNDMLENDNQYMKKEIQEENASNIKLAQENEELRCNIESHISSKTAIAAENVYIKSCLCETEKINEDLNKKLQSAIVTINEMKAMMQASQDEIKQFEKSNQELKETVKDLKNAQSADKSEEYEDKINNLVAENETLKKELEKERHYIASLKKHIDSLQFYHENEMETNKSRLNELKDDSNMKKKNLQTEIGKLTSMNALLEQKLNAIEDENKQLQINITELNEEITTLNDKLQNTDILHDPQKYVDALDAINQENIEMKNAMNVLREILEVKLGEKVSSVTDFIEAKRSSTASSNGSQKHVLEKISESSNEEQIANVTNSTHRKKFLSLQQICDNSLVSNVDESIQQRVNNIEKKIDKIINDISMSSEKSKATSMPNLDTVGFDEYGALDNADVNLTNDANRKKFLSCKQICGDRNADEFYRQKEDSIEKKNNVTVLNVSVSPEKSKSTSMPNLDAAGIDEYEALDNADVNLTKFLSCKQICGNFLGQNVDESYQQRVDIIEKQIDQIVDDVTMSPKESNSTSMPNLDEIRIDVHEAPNRVLVVAKSVPNNIVRKSSSLEFISSKNVADRNCCESKWEKHMKSIHKLRTELSDILAKIDENREEGPKARTENTSNKCTNKYKQMICSIQKQINELQVRSVQESNKNCDLQEELKEIKGQMCNQVNMEDEVYRLRKELYKQKVERIKESEETKIKRNAEIYAAQLEAKFQYLECKKKLLLDLTAVQNALQVKNEEENKIKQKCDELVKEVTANQEARKKKLQDIALLTAQPLSSNIQKNVICEVPGASHQVFKPECSGYPKKPVKPHALVINARKKLNTLEKHRLSTESVPEPSSSDEELLRKKYLLQ